jgi:hypothetical protein
MHEHGLEGRKEPRAPLLDSRSGGEEVEEGLDTDNLRLKPQRVEHHKADLKDRRRK